MIFSKMCKVLSKMCKVFKNHENQNYNFAGKKEECVTWHFKDVFEIYQGTSRPP
jgi:hypothetical protein